MKHLNPNLTPNRETGRDGRSAPSASVASIHHTSTSYPDAFIYPTW